MSIPAEVAQRNLIGPDGAMDSCWVVTAIEEGGKSVVIFSGVDASERATAYARANYKPVHFRVLAEPGRLGMSGSAIGAGAH